MFDFSTGYFTLCSFEIFDVGLTEDCSTMIIIVLTYRRKENDRQDKKV